MNYKVLARVPALSCRLGRVPYDRAFGTLIVHSLSITKKFDFRKKLTYMGLNLVSLLSETVAPPTQPLADVEV